MRVFYYTIYYFLVYLIFLIKTTAGEETLKKGFHSSFFLLFKKYIMIRGPPKAFQIKSDLKGD